MHDLPDRLWTVAAVWGLSRLGPRRRSMPRSVRASRIPVHHARAGAGSRLSRPAGRIRHVGRLHRNAGDPGREGAPKTQKNQATACAYSDVGGHRLLGRLPARHSVRAVKHPGGGRRRQASRPEPDAREAAVIDCSGSGGSARRPKLPRFSSGLIVADSPEPGNLSEVVDCKAR